MRTVTTETGLTRRLPEQLPLILRRRGAPSRCPAGEERVLKSVTTATTSRMTAATPSAGAPSAATARLDPGEQCDDGNRVNGDGCLLSCQTARCGDGVLHLGEEQCDDGNNLQTDNCLVDCTVARCGDGHVRDGVETCDDGNAQDEGRVPHQLSGRSLRRWDQTTGPR